MAGSAAARPRDRCSFGLSVHRARRKHRGPCPAGFGALRSWRMLPARLRRGDGASGRGLARGFLHQHADLVRQLRALGNPVLHARGVELDVLLVTLRNWVVETQALERAAVALVAVVGGDDVVEGTLLGAAAGQANLDHGSVYSLLEWPEPGSGEPRSIRNPNGFRQLAPETGGKAPAHAAGAHQALHAAHHALEAAAGQLGHHLFHLLVLLEQLVDLRRGGPGALGHAGPARAVQQP